MEIVLQWLDDLDDLVFAGALKWESLRRRALQAGLLSTLALAGCERAAAAPVWVLALAAIAVSSVALWSAGAAAALLEAQSGRLPARA